MSFLDPSRAARHPFVAPALIALALGTVAGCQKSDDRPPFLACDGDCSPLPSISVGTGGPGGAGAGNTGDAGPGTLTGQVLVLNDQTFAQGTLYASGATVTADGANGTPVSANWDGADDFSLDGVAKVSTNWVSVKPTLMGGDPLLTYQAIDTSDLTTVNLAMVSGAVLDAIFNSVSQLRSQSGAGQVVLFFRSKGTSAPLPGLHVAMPQAEQALYRSGTAWVVDDGTSITDQTGLVVFTNVAPGNSSGTQTVTVTKAASGSTPAVNAGSFAVKVVDSAVTIATVSVQL